VAITEHETNQTEPRAQASGRDKELSRSNRTTTAREWPQQATKSIKKENSASHKTKQNHPATNNRRVAVPPNTQTPQPGPATTDQPINGKNRENVTKCNIL
jgi:hypothetical protein